MRYFSKVSKCSACLVFQVSSSLANLLRHGRRGAIKVRGRNAYPVGGGWFHITAAATDVADLRQCATHIKMRIRNLLMLEHRPAQVETLAAPVEVVSGTPRKRIVKVRQGLIDRSAQARQGLEEELRQYLMRSLQAASLAVRVAQLNAKFH